MSNENDQLLQLCERARDAKYAVQQLGTDKKNAALRLVADKLVEATDRIIEANKIDYKASEDKGVSPALLDRLMLNKERIEAMAEGVRQVADLPDPVGEILEEFERPNGLKFKKVRIPLGVIGIIYESRPNVTADAFALTFKSGNAVILKGGSDAINSNIAIVEAIQKGLEESGITGSAIELMKSTDRETTTRFMHMTDYVDVLIPRGSKGLIKAVSENSKIPVLYAAAGNCHIYIDKDADVDKAVKIAVNAKTQRLGVCNAAESLVVHEAVLDTVLPKVAAALREKNVVLYSDPASLKAFSDAEPATEEDFATEYLDLKMSVKTVKNVDEAIEHINRYSTHHSEAIITENSETAERFLDGVDSACVYWNASTRWTDGFEFGFGAEIGICTQKLHARGPMGLKELTSYKYKITGNGQIRG